MSFHNNFTMTRETRDISWFYKILFMASVCITDDKMKYRSRDIYIVHMRNEH